MLVLINLCFNLYYVVTQIHILIQNMIGFGKMYINKKHSNAGIKYQINFGVMRKEKIWHLLIIEANASFTILRLNLAIRNSDHSNVVC